MIERLNIDVPVYHLEGGILAYLDEVPPSESTFSGECYVFDRRVAVSHGLKPSTDLTQCHACRHPLTPDDRASEDYRPGVVCPHCKDDEHRRRERYEARQMHVQVAEEKGICHIGCGADDAGDSCDHGTEPAELPQVSRRGIPRVRGCPNHHQEEPNHKNSSPSLKVQRAR